MINNYYLSLFIELALILQYSIIIQGCDVPVNASVPMGKAARLFCFHIIDICI